MIANVRFIDRALRIEVGGAQNAAAALVGSAVFGVGWSIAWFCPGAALPALGTGRIEVVAFVAALIAGIFGAKGLWP